MVRLMNVETGPLGGLALIAVVVLAILAFLLTSWWVSGLVLAALLAIVVLIVYYGLQRVDSRLRHGARRGRP